ncbi:hypothetical protein [Saccharomonospora saliphila]|uniref:hypothetical protein n=1 Tax=Saccharomonospora saliphila TaxID=369829 RepID=UPI0006626189|nr:hypothetical protein [Saccharomonospora saliphila]
MRRAGRPGFLGRLFGPPVPEPVRSELAADEHVVAHAPVETGGHVAVTALGLWVPDGGASVRRIGWHLVSKAVWREGALTVTEAEVTGYAGDAVLLADRTPVRHALPKPGRIPHLVRLRVESSIRSRYHKDLPGGGAWFVVRKLPGTDGVVLQVRPDPGTDTDVVSDIAEQAAAKLADGS